MKSWHWGRSSKGPPNTLEGLPSTHADSILVSARISRRGLDIAVDPGQVGCHSGVDSRKAGKTTFLPPTHHSYLDPGAPPVTDQGAPRVALWRIDR